MTEAIRIERDGDVAIIVIDNPPINAGSAPVRRGLLAAIEEIGRDAAVRAAVVIGAGKTFIAGSDLREFDLPLQESQSPAVIAAIEACGKPVVAALHGAALGRGFELALGCDGRIALAGTMVGLPEVSLGIIPGAGGTQRLPRIVGIPAALRLIASGERVPATKALALGMVDEVVDGVTDGDLRPAAVAFARRLGDGKTRLRDRAVPAADDGEVAAATRDALKAGRNRPAVRAAVEAVAGAALLPIDEGLARERAAFQELRVSRDAKALRHLFFAERESARHPDLAGAAPRRVERIGVVGAGTMGTGIAIAWRMRQAQVATRDPLARYVTIPDRLCEAGRLGRKTGAGYYLYADGGRGRQSDPVVRALIDRASAKKGIARRSMDDDEIRRRALLAMMNEAALQLAEGVAARPGDIDLVLTNGYGFPLWEGGPVFLAREGVVNLLTE